MTRGSMRHVEHTEDIDLMPWEFCFTSDDVLRDLTAVQTEAIKRIVTEVLRQAFVDDPPQLTFVACHGEDGDGRGDPVTMYVDLPLASHSDLICSHAVSLEDAIDEAIDMRRSGYDEDMCRKIAARLRELANKLDDAC